MIETLLTLYPFVIQWCIGISTIKYMTFRNILPTNSANLLQWDYGELRASLTKNTIGEGMNGC